MAMYIRDGSEAPVESIPQHIKRLELSRHLHFKILTSQSLLKHFLTPKWSTS